MSGPRTRLALAAHAILGASAVLALAGCGVLASVVASDPAPTAPTTYTRHLHLAVAGNVESQNAVGYMLFFGDGVTRDRRQAQVWFHRAAERGSARADRNLAVMHRLGAGAPKDDAEADRRFQRSRERSGGPWSTLDELIGAGLRPPDARPGERTYAMFCAGCHGLNGIAAFVASPSFALGERLHRSDAELLDSLRRGIGSMPAWGDKLSPAELSALLAFVRGFPREYEFGVARVLRPVPRLYFLFGPMRERELAYQPADD